MIHRFFGIAFCAKRETHHRLITDRNVVTTESMRDFSFACLKWARRCRNPSDRQVMVSAAREWLNLAEQIDRYVESGRGEMVPDLKGKLN